jgi:hypothetical protein
MGARAVALGGAWVPPRRARRATARADYGDALLPLLLAACAEPEGSARVLAGLRQSWSLLSHRVSRAGVVLAEDGALQVSMVGGDFSTGEAMTDTPEYQVTVATITAPGLVSATGSTEFQVGPGEDERAFEEEDVEIRGAEGYASCVALSRGFTLETDVAQGPDYPDDYDPALGYTSRGLSWGVSFAVPEGSSVIFSAMAAAKWGPAGPDDPIDRSAMNAAIPLAVTAMTVHWTVICTRDPIEVGTARASATLPHDPPYSEQEPLHDDVGAAAIPTRAELTLEVPANSGQGEYLRSWGAWAPGGSVAMELTNSSAVETAAIAVTAEADYAVLAGCCTVQEEVLEGTFETGTTTLPPR